MGRLKMGSKCLLVILVRGKSRDPAPPARITPFMWLISREFYKSIERALPIAPKLRPIIESRLKWLGASPPGKMRKKAGKARPRPHQLARLALLDLAWPEDWIPANARPQQTANHAALAGMRRLKSKKLWMRIPRTPIAAPSCIQPATFFGPAPKYREMRLRKMAKAPRISTPPITPVSARASA